jgi:hypothetical protein
MKKIYTCIFITSLLALHSRANIIYTDVSPDVVNTGNTTLDIDVNNDGTMDFEITGAAAQTASFDIVQAGQVGTNNFVLSDGTGGASALALNTVIGSASTTWYQMNANNLIMISVFNNQATGNWVNATDKYLGLQFIVNSFTYYGWARFTIGSADNTYTFKDYAYEDAAGQSILAGQTITGVSPELSMGHLKFYPNPSSGLIYFEKKDTEGFKFTLTDVAGKVVLEKIMSGEHGIDLGILENGLYFFTLSNSEMKESGKVEIVN